MSDSNAVITRTQLVNRAFRRIGIDSPSTNESAQAVEALNIIMKELDSEGRWLHCISNTASSLTLVNGQANYAAGSGASLIPTAVYELERVDLVINSAPYTPLAELSRDHWFRSALRGTSGQPLEVYLEKKADFANNVLWFAPTPDSAYTAQIWYRRRLYDFDNASDNPDFPADWGYRLVKRLAYELAPEFGVPLQERALIKAESDEAMQKGAAANAEKPTPGPTRRKGQYF